MVTVEFFGTDRRDSKVHGNAISRTRPDADSGNGAPELCLWVRLRTTSPVPDDGGRNGVCICQGYTEGRGRLVQAVVTQEVKNLERQM